MIITVKGARISKGLSQKQVATALNLSVQAYQNKENAKSNFYAHEIMILCKILEIEYEYFFDVMCTKNTQK